MVDQFYTYQTSTGFTQVRVHMLAHHDVPNNIMACLEVKKWRGSRVKGGGVVQLPYLEVF